MGLPGAYERGACFFCVKKSHKWDACPDAPDKDKKEFLRLKDAFAVCRKGEDHLVE